MKKQKIRFAIFMLLLAVTACDNADYSKSAPFDNGVYLSVAESKTSETMTFNKTIIQREKSFTARLAYPAGTDVTVNVTVDPSQVEAYNSRNNTSYDIADQTLPIGEQRNDNTRRQNQFCSVTYLFRKPDRIGD